ncbi:MAG: DNA-processing protein DprA [Micrococcales bacterium]|nr:DNA-processing protein DprA [Micrococcales bacterium]
MTEGRETGEREARAVWTVLSEPGDPVAGRLLAWVGAGRALTWVRSVGRHRPDWSVLEPDLDGVADPERERLLRRGRTWAARLSGAEAVLDIGSRAGMELVVPGDPSWPAGLVDLDETAPHALWVRGRLSDTSRVAVVGARACTAYGRRVATDLADDLARRGAVVVSGGAYGIDAAVHRGALGSGATWAVLASGLDRGYPAGHAGLFEQIVTGGGALLGEAPPGAVPARSRFLRRNRLIAALTSGTVVVEAAWRSGALSTANHAARLLRPVGAVPGPVTSAASAGCHRLLREQVAVCVTDAAEVVDLVGPLEGARRPADPADSSPLDGLDAGIRSVHDALSVRVPSTSCELAVRTGLAVAVVRAGLGRLELVGLARREGEVWQAVPVRRVRVGSSDVSVE